MLEMVPITDGPRIIVASAEIFAQSAARVISETVRGLILTQRRVSVALAGGSTPREVYTTIGKSDCCSTLPWRSIDFYFGDERCVPIHDPSSNYKMVCETLFAGANMSFLSVYRMEGEIPDYDQAAKNYEGRLPCEVDLILLGIGEDAHVASLFPLSPAVREIKRRVVSVIGPAPPHRRITMTPLALRLAKHLIVMAIGSRKAWAVQQALEGEDDPNRVPAQLARAGTWILDPGAASLLRQRHMERGTSNVEQ